MRNMRGRRGGETCSNKSLQILEAESQVDVVGEIFIFPYFRLSLQTLVLLTRAGEST